MPSLAVTFAVFTALLALPPAAPQHQWPQVDSDTAVGLRAVDCWFEPDSTLPPIECYRMQVPERHDSANTRIISFPVMVIRAENRQRQRAPLLHLGAGGPGAPMYLDRRETALDLAWSLNQASIAQGRDLVAIDPRGTGMARPRLACDEFVTGERRRLEQHLTLSQMRGSVVSDYRRCIDRYLADGVDFSGYNSFAVARDIESLRRTIGIDRWVLLGISYGANYALTLADLYPDTIEAMVLDSAYVARTDTSQRYLDWLIKPYQRLFDYCEYDPQCDAPLPRVRERFWKLHASLERDPLVIDFAHGRDRIALVLDGARFLEAIMQGVYGVEIYRDLPRIITQLERGEYSALRPYLRQHVDYMLDTDWGDVSEMAHYCYETGPFMDYERIRASFAELPPGHLRDTAEFFLDWPDHCAQMKIDSAAPQLVPSRPVQAPTLFLHGRFDSITPLAHVLEIQEYFQRPQLVGFDLGHSILTSSHCALGSAAKFIDNPAIPYAQLRCD